MPLTISEVTAKRLPPVAVAAIAFLEKQSPDQVFSADELAAEVKSSRSYFKDNGSAFEDYRAVVRGRSYYGSKRAIANLRKQMGAK